MKLFHRSRGFTLIELIVVVAILAILAGFAVPSYMQYVLRSHRVEARNALQEMANRLQQNYSVTRTWSKLGDGTDVVIGNALPLKWNLSQTPASGSARYLITVVSVSDTGYQLKATAQGAQASDICGAMFLDQSGSKKAAKNPEADVPSGSRDAISIECWSK